MADGDCVAVGRLAPQQREFGNLFTLSAQVMLRACHRHYAATEH
ncbi:hypothetical protein [Streptomyces sp. NPDC049915]